MSHRIADVRYVYAPGVTNNHVVGLEHLCECGGWAETFAQGTDIRWVLYRHWMHVLESLAAAS